ncbi:MAG: hypothetical protein ACLPSF_07550 [Methylocella sp.]
MILGAIGDWKSGRRKRAVHAARLWALALACGLAPGLASSPSSRALAADFDEGPRPTAADGGVACSIGQPFWVPSRETAETLPWPAVYLGHFSGGRPYLDADGRTLIDWRDEYFCFPSSAQCGAWVRDSYRAYHQPEGYRACLLLR